MIYQSQVTHQALHEPARRLLLLLHLPNKHGLKLGVWAQPAQLSWRHTQRQNSSMKHIYYAWLIYSWLRSSNPGRHLKDWQHLPFSLYLLSPCLLPRLVSTIHTHMPAFCSNSKSKASRSSRKQSSRPSAPDSFRRSASRTSSAWDS